MSKFMTHVGALEAMRKGYKVAHLSFTSDEYLCIDDEGVIRCEMGYNFTKGFEDRKDWDPEWFIREEPKQCNCICHRSSGNVMHIVPCC